MKKSTLRTTAAWQALALLGAGVPAAFIAATPAAAQDYTSGVISGTVTTESGAPVSGATVKIVSKATGATATTTTNSNGSFSVSQLPGGYHDVTVTSAGTVPFRATDVTVLAGQTSDLSIQTTAATGASTDSNEVVVVGSRIQAFTGTQTGLAVNVEELTKSVPLGRSLTDVVLLAPGTVKGDAAFGDLASIGGSSVAENAYYINGLNITNFDNYLGSARVPFDFYKSVEVKSGGYPAEFGRATGGIVNTVSKSGTNDFMAALHLNWTPKGLQAQGKDLISCSTNGTCVNATNRSNDYNTALTATMEAGGPILKDRLFAYGLLELRDVTSQTVNPIAKTAFQFEQKDPFWGVKLDAYPIDDHHLEFTIFNSKDTNTRSDVAYSEDANGNGVYGLAGSIQDFNRGGVNYVGKYTGRFTDFLTVSGAYGRMRDRFDNVGIAGGAGLPRSSNASGATRFGVANGGFYNGQRTLSTTRPWETEREFYRADADIYANLMGDHHFRLGFDRENNTLAKTSTRNGGAFECATGFLTAAACSANGGGGAALILRAPDATGVPIVEINYFNSGGSFEAVNKAYYLQDEWQPTDRLTLSLGVRRDDFLVNKADGTNLVTLDKNYAPRLGMTYELGENRDSKIKAFYGQYYLPFASNTAFRMTGNEYFFRERFYVTGYDANGIPTLGAQVTNIPSYQSTCPFGLTPKSSGKNCSVTGDGSVPDASALIAANLKATKEAEFIIGYERRLGRWKAGINYTNRRLLTTAEDAAIDKAVLNYCTANGIAGCSSTWTGFHQYTIINPGSDIVVNLDGLDGRQVTISADDSGYPKAVRKYDAVELQVERPNDGVWGVGGSYTWSKSRGNSEGFVQSDFGQADAGITQDFDQPGFVDGSYGNLPNDRRHKIKLWGSYTFAEKLTLGTNIRVESPRPLSCFGYHPTDVFAQVYGAGSHYCGGTLSPRGTAQKSDWVKTIDLKGAYRLAIPSGQTLTLRADVFNIFNSQSVQARNEIGDLAQNPVAGGGYTYVANPNYTQPTVYQTPRAVRLGLDLTF